MAKRLSNTWLMCSGSEPQGMSRAHSALIYSTAHLVGCPSNDLFFLCILWCIPTAAALISGYWCFLEGALMVKCNDLDKLMSKGTQEIES
jgi:hypothetical protein